jgi:membrane metallo-endopeptidase-like protein 1
MDLSVDPCEDFNLYSCGSYIKNTRIPDDASKYDVFDILRIRLAYSVAGLFIKILNV